LLFLSLASVAVVAGACGDSEADGTTSSGGCPPGVICGEGGSGANNSNNSSNASTGNGQGGGCQEAWLCSPWESSPPGSDEGFRVCTDLAACGTTAAKPVEMATLPALDLDYYKCEIEPIMNASCSMLGCHGTDSRPLRTYSRGRFRNVEESVVNPCPGGGMTPLSECIGSIECGCWQSPHTGVEWQRNYDAARGFGLDPQGNPLSDNEQSELIQQPMEGGGKAHAGFKMFDPGSPEHTKIKAWLDGTTFGQTCQTNN